MNNVQDRSAAANVDVAFFMPEEPAESEVAPACELIAMAEGMTSCPHCRKPASDKDTTCRFCNETLTP